MTARTITLGKEVMVSDPHYTEPTWCQIKLDNVKPGNYIAYHKTYEYTDGGFLPSMILVIHQDHNDDEDLVWDLEDGEVGVDSGQAGIFSYETFRKDGLEMEVPTVGWDGKSFEWLESIMKDKEDGDDWYLKMTKMTLTTERWGTYDQGIVSRSGQGDGSYNLYTASIDGEVVAMAVDFAVEEEPVIDFEFFK
jgi:hypothetical protein